MMARRRSERRLQQEIDRLRDELLDSIRVEADAESPGVVWLAVCDDASDTWARVPIGTGDVPEVMALLESARARAQEALDGTVRSRLELP